MKRFWGRFFFILALLLFLWTETSHAGFSVLGGLTREMVGQPGQKLEGTIELKNTGPQPIEVNIKKNDYLFFADGRNIYGEPGSTPRSNAKWLSVTPTRLIIPSQSTASVYYSVQIPSDKTLKGTYWSILMVEPSGEAGSKIVGGGKDKITFGIQTRIRYGIQIVTHIGDTGQKNLRIIDRKLIKEKDGTGVLQLDMENTGERWLRPWVRAELYDQSGHLVKKLECGRLRIYPGTSVRSRIAFQGIPRGKYKVLVIIDDGDGYVWGAQYILQLS